MPYVFIFFSRTFVQGLTELKHHAMKVRVVQLASRDRGLNVMVDNVKLAVGDSWIHQPDDDFLATSKMPVTAHKQGHRSAVQIDHSCQKAFRIGWEENLGVPGITQTGFNSPIRIKVGYHVLLLPSKSLYLMKNKRLASMIISA
jgi:hypothetical protein